MDELAEVKQELGEVKKDIVDIKDNHLVSIKGEIRNLRWFIMASLTVLGLVLGVVLVIIQVYG